MKEDLKGWVEGEYDQEGNPVIPEAEYIWFMHDRFFSHPEPRLSHWLGAHISTHNASRKGRREQDSLVLATYGRNSRRTRYSEIPQQRRKNEII